MVSCSKCSTPNSVDSLFCKHCGAEIATEVRSEAQQKLQDLVSEGYRIFNEGRTDEARLVAESVLAEEPSSASAISLKGMCHERQSELALALECYERVVELNPDSALDKIKVTHLRQALAGKVLATPEPRRGRAIFGALAATGLVVAIGAAIAAFSQPKNAIAQNREATGNLDSQTLPFSPAPAGLPSPKPNADTAAAETTRAPAGDNIAATPPRTPSAGSTIPSWGRDNSIRLPRVEDGIGSSDQRPLAVAPPIGPATVVRDPDPVMEAGDVDPVVEGSRGSGLSRVASGGDPTPKSTERPSIIDIRLTQPAGSGNAGEPGANANGVEALLKTANQQFLLGRFPQAANTYEAALRAGANPGQVNQRLGQVYANLKRDSDAANAYRRAIASYEGALRNGSGNADSLRSAIESCKAALKNLGG